jgi:hypothetical protein
MSQRASVPPCWRLKTVSFISLPKSSGSLVRKSIRPAQPAEIFLTVTSL